MPQKMMPYWTFVTAKRTEAERAGRTLSEEECGMRWQSMTDAEREPYKEMARQRNATRKLTVQPTTPSKASNETWPIATRSSPNHQTETTDTSELMRKLRGYFSRTLDGAKKKKFLVMASNLLLPFDSAEECIPLEVAMTMYSVSDGVTARLHQFTDPGIIPMGRIYDSRLHSLQTHRIPAVDFPLVMKKEDFPHLMDALVEQMRICYDNTIPIFIFTMAHMVDQVRETLYFYAEQSVHAGMRQLLDEKQILVVDLALLLSYLSMLAGVPIEAEPDCHRIMQSVVFDYKNSCTFHERIDNNHCALSLCFRWCFLMSDYLLALPAMRVTPIPGRHLPWTDVSPIHHQDYRGIRFWGEAPPEAGSEAEAVAEEAVLPVARSRVPGPRTATGFSLRSHDLMQ